MDYQPGVSQKEIANTLMDIGLGHGATVIVHSSLSSLGYVVGGADAVIDALLGVVGPSGNVMVPTLTGTEGDGPDNPPFFDVKTTPCWTGRIPTVFMQRKEALRSLHPTHSVSVIGPLAREFTSGHHLARYPCSEGTPYLRLARNGGFILLLGVDQQSNTTLHTVEEIAKVPYHLQTEPTTSTVIDYEGRKLKVTGHLHRWGTARDFNKIDNELLQRGIMKVGRVGRAALRLIDSLAMIELLVERLRRNPSYFVQSLG